MNRSISKETNIKQCLIVIKYSGRCPTTHCDLCIGINTDCAHKGFIQEVKDYLATCTEEQILEALL